MTETAGHVELYKKYRPKTWNELIGQQKIASSLKAAVSQNKLPTAYGFFGPRGCGKTSSALLLAKAINCLNPTKDSSPCNECEVCIAIDNGTQLGVNYISMANNGSVEDIRNIVQKARLTQPVKRQIWILDEIHNIHKSGFDSLLIPIEDKNMPALFILCSTEIEKIPATIMSRIQSRKFNLVSSEEMLQFLKVIREKESLESTDEQLMEAVRLGRGSVRDTLSALEGIVSMNEDLSPTFGGKLLESIASRSLTNVLTVIAEASSDGISARDLSEQLYEDLRNLVLTNAKVDSSLIGVLPVNDPEEIARKLLGNRGLNILMNELGLALTRMSNGMDYRINLEIAMNESLTKLSKLQKLLAAQSNK